MAVVYHWRHGWIPLDHVAALSKAKGNHEAAARMLADAHSTEAGIKSRRDVARAARDLTDIRHTGDRAEAASQLRSAAEKHGASDLLPGHIGNEDKIPNAEKMFGTGSEQHRAAIERFGGKPEVKLQENDVRISSPHGYVAEWDHRTRRWMIKDSDGRVIGHIGGSSGRSQSRDEARKRVLLEEGRHDSNVAGHKAAVEAATRRREVEAKQRADAEARRVREDAATSSISGPPPRFGTSRPATERQVAYVVSLLDKHRDEGGGYVSTERFYNKDGSIKRGAVTRLTASQISALIDSLRGNY